MKKINKDKWVKELGNKTTETHAQIMQKLGITEEEDKERHAENGGTPADFSKLNKSK